MKVVTQKDVTNDKGEIERRIRVDAQGEVAFSFLGSLIWHIIDSYWTTFVFIFSLVPNKFVSESLILQKVSQSISSLRSNGLLIVFMRKESINSMKVAVKKQLEMQL
jgi:hypothetical protein